LEQVFTLDPGERLTRGAKLYLTEPEAPPLVTLGTAVEGPACLDRSDRYEVGWVYIPEPTAEQRSQRNLRTVPGWNVPLGGWVYPRWLERGRG
jgi:hypothetical protein